jgi:hypothetical protein
MRTSLQNCCSTFQDIFVAASRIFSNAAMSFCVGIFVITCEPRALEENKTVSLVSFESEGK